METRPFTMEICHYSILAAAPPGNLGLAPLT